jgi:hypothetical protein
MTVLAQQRIFAKKRVNLISLYNKPIITDLRDYEYFESKSSKSSENPGDGRLELESERMGRIEQKRKNCEIFDKYSGRSTD